jgi:hypothetical protein
MSILLLAHSHRMMSQAVMATHDKPIGVNPGFSPKRPLRLV